MLRLNIRCLNNQARFDPVKEKERGTEEDEPSRLLSSRRRRKRRRFRFRPSRNGTRSSPFLAVPRFRSAPDPPACPSRVNHPLRLCLTLCRLSSFFLAPTFLRILPRRPYRKCIYVLCKAGNRRWPREPDARRVINTDALVLRSLSLSLSHPSLSFPFLSLFISRRIRRFEFFHIIGFVDKIQENARSVIVVTFPDLLDPSTRGIHED